MPERPTRTADPDPPTADPRLTASLADPAGTTDDTTPAPAAPLPATAGRYTLDAEIARGGMGIIYRATDIAFQREVAIKVLQERFGPASAAAHRFADEARITGQLQHPGIPPVHDLGILSDGRPFLAMKLIKGETLDAQLAARRTPADDRGRFVAIFEQLCQAVAYAHAHGVIHRDLKPSNVMVGNFSEVQVMDWGLAKVLTNRDGRPDPDPNATSSGTKILPLRDSDAALTQAGSVLGTPAFMAPEQAVGAVGKIDQRSDVFGLGGILAAVLTGLPPFQGGTAETTRVKAAQGNVGDCFARLDACGADPELVALAKRCLTPRQDDRPADAGVVAQAAAALRAAADERAQQAELDRVKAEGERATAEARAEEEANTRRVAEEKAAEQRKRRRVQLALAAVVGLLVSGIAAFGWWRNEQANERTLADERAEAERLRIDAGRKVAEARAEEEAKFKGQQARQGIDSALALATGLRKQYRFADAGRSLAQAAKLAESGAPERREEVKQAQRDLAFVVQLDEIRSGKWIWYTNKRTPDAKRVTSKYQQAFAAYGLDLVTLAPADAASQIAASAIKAELVAAVDDWAAHEIGKTPQPRLLEVARRADPGAWTDRLRDPSLYRDRAALEKLAADADLERTAPTAISILAVLMWGRDLDPSPMLTAARVLHPAEFELAFSLGNWHFKNSKGGQHFGPFEAARALRPDSVAVWCNLGNALYDKGDVSGAIAAHKKAIELDPKLAPAHNNLGNALAAQGDRDGAIAAYKRAVELDPTLVSARTNLGVDLHARGELNEAIAAFKKALELDPQFALAHTSLGLALFDKGDVFGSIAAHKKAIEFDPTLALAHSNLGTSLHARGDLVGAIAATRKAIELDPKLAKAHFNLGTSLYANGDLTEAVTAFKKAIELDPKFAKAHANLGAALHARGDLVGAIAATRKAIELDPKDVIAHNLLGNVLRAKGDAPGAIAAYKKAIELDPTVAFVYYNLGITLSDRRDMDGAIAAFKKAIELDPKLAPAHTDLGVVYFQQKKYPEAIVCARAAIKANPLYAPAHAMLGDLLLRTGDTSGARAALTEAARLDKRWAPMLAKVPPIPVAPPPREVKQP